MTEYQKQQLLTQLATEGLHHRSIRIALRRERLQRSQEMLEHLEKEYVAGREAVQQLALQKAY